MAAYFALRNTKSAAAAKKAYTDQLVAKIIASRDTFLPQRKAVVDSQYYQCINK